MSSCFAKLYQINRVRRSFDKETLELLITSLAFSKMLYCLSVWSNTTLQNIRRLQSIQNFASKIVTNSKKFDQVTPLLRELNWLPVKEQFFYRDSVLTFICHNDLAPQYLTSKFTKRSNIHTRNTRTRNSLQIPLNRTVIGQRTFSYRGAYTWNNLQNELRQSASLASFKRARKDTLLRQTFPS